MEKTADPEKMATFEKNIGLAFYNKGKWGNAAGFLIVSYRRWGVGSPRSQALRAYRARDLLRVIIVLYLPHKLGKMPSERDNEIFDLIYKRNTALIYLDTRRFACEVMAMFKRPTDLT